MLTPTICYPHRRLSPHTRRPQSGCDGLSQFKEDTGEPSVPAKEFHLTACRNLTLTCWQEWKTNPRPAELVSQAPCTAAPTALALWATEAGISMPHFVKVGQLVAKILRFFYFSRWQLPPSCVVQFAKFYWLTVTGGRRRITVPNFVKTGQ